MSVTLVTGSAASAPGRRPRCKARAPTVVYAPAREPVNREALDLLAGSVDCYVQLPADSSSRIPTAPDAMHHVVLAGILARLDALEEVAPLLAPTARVVLVADAEQAPYVMMLRSLVATFARVILDTDVGSTVRITLMPAHPSPDDIAAAAHETAGIHRLQSLADLEPEHLFTDWRDDAMLLWGIAEEVGGCPACRVRHL